MNYVKENLELDPLFDQSFDARLKRFFKRILGSRYLLIALLIHVLILIIFGGKILFEAYQQVNLESDSIIAPHPGPPSQPPPSSSEIKTYDVKVTVPQNSSLMNKLATDKLSVDFNVATPEVQNSISVSMEGIGVGTGSGSGTGNGSGFANVSFFGISGKASKVIFVADISASMNKGEKVGRPYESVIKEVAKGMSNLTEANEFNIITFAKQAYPYKPKLVRATPQEKEQAIEWFKKLTPSVLRQLKETGKPDMIGDVTDAHLGSRADLALEEALKMKPAMIMFISDGIPTGLKERGAPGLIDDVTKWRMKYSSQTSINTVFYKTSNSEKGPECKDFMTKLANQNGGQFRPVE